MHAPRFSLRFILIATAYTAVVVAGFVKGTPVWASAVFSISVGILLLATLAALFRGDDDRTYWQGFSIIAWIYLLLAIGTVSVSNRLVTTRILHESQYLLGPIQAANYVEPGFTLKRLGPNDFQIGPGSDFNIWGPSWTATHQIGHSAWAILLGLAGGYAALYFHRVQKPSSGLRDRTN
jgi:hypothetical protein